MERKPPWLKVSLPSGETYKEVKAILSRFQLHTVCQEARCPNVGECFGQGTATFMILGDICTRCCKFCAVKTGNPQGVVDQDEPERIASAVKELKLKFVVITSVDRDDLPDKGSDHFARTIRAIKNESPRTAIEVLVPDFGGDEKLIDNVVDAKPDILGHNVETVARLTPAIRDRRTRYQRSLDVLKTVKDHSPPQVTKSGFMVGMGETEDEILKTIQDLKNAQVDVLTIGQYLQPTKSHLPVKEFVPPEKFNDYKRTAEALGFKSVAAGPLVRSSYRAADMVLAKAANAHY
jgi:lipoic acid synthetase